MLFLNPHKTKKFLSLLFLHIFILDNIETDYSWHVIITNFMKQIIFLLTVMGLILSCGRESSKQITEKVKVEPAKAVDPFDWSKPKLLKQKYLDALDQADSLTDKILTDFINEYTNLEIEFNEILNKLPNYDTLNTIAYSMDGKTHPSAIEFERVVRENGFKIAATEGNIYIAKNSGFIKSRIIELLDPVSREFLNLYCNEIDSICCDDAALIIPESSLVYRIYNWGELSGKVATLAYEKIVETEFYNNLFLLFSGQDNTPSFEWETEKFRQKYLDLMNSIVLMYPESRAAQEFKVYTSLLASENFQKTEKVDEFLNEKFKPLFSNY